MFFFFFSPHFGFVPVCLRRGESRGQRVKMFPEKGHYDSGGQRTAAPLCDRRMIRLLLLLFKCVRNVGYKKKKNVGILEFPSRCLVCGSHINWFSSRRLCVFSFFFRTPCWTWNSRWALRWGGGGEAVEKSSSVHLRQSKWTPEQPGLRRPSWSQFGSREGLYDGLAPLATCTSTCT